MRTAIAIVAMSVAVAAISAPTDGNLAPAAATPAELGVALDRYRAIEARGGWPVLPPTETVHPGDRSTITPLLRTRLAVAGDLGATPPPTATLPAPPADLYAAELVQAVRTFQTRHGLAVDGVIGPRTLAALNVPVRRRIAQLELAVERARRRSPPDATRYVRVNIPAYSLELVEDGQPVLEMPVVVGRPDRATPEMTSAINFLVLNPPWTIPTKLAYEDILPKARRNPNYFAAHGIQIYSGWRLDAEEIDPDWIDWRLIGPSIKGLKLRQAPGAGNPLGRIKFHMANAFDVYLHDTSSRGLMAHANRALSSGCVRVGDARALAGAVLATNPGWSRERIDEVIGSRKTTKVRLREPVPVQLYYQTAWTTADGRVHFRNDIYGYDDAFATELATAQPPERPPLGRAGPPAIADGIGD